MTVSSDTSDDKPVRVDAWLWSVRLFKTRSAAGDACSSGRVRVGGEVVKPARRVTPGDEVEVRRPDRTGRYRVVRTIAKRVGASIAVECYQLLEEFDHRARRADTPAAWGERERGAGRPTKRDRRQMDRFRQGG